MLIKQIPLNPSFSKGEANNDIPGGQNSVTQPTQNTPPGQTGFTLIELVMVMVIVGILGAMSTKIITLPVNSYLDLARRTAMVDAADMSLRRMQRDVRRALPNSLRIKSDANGISLELLHTIDGGRYRARQDGTLGSTAGKCSVGGDPANDILDFTISDTCFEVLGSLNSFNPQATNGESLVVYNLDASTTSPYTSSSSAYTGGNLTPVQNSINASVINFTAKQFPYNSPLQRFFIVDTAVTYRCDTTNKQLLRYSGYSLAAIQSVIPVGGTAQIQANNVAGCQFYYIAGVATRAAQLRAVITLTDANGETVNMVRQIHVDNAP